MTGELERRWRAALTPFDGLTVASASADLTPLPALRLALLAVASALRQRWPEPALFTLDDWHEHDGFLSAARPASWQDLSDALASDKALLTLSHGDSEVRRAFFPATYDFYLRVYVPDDFDNGYPERRGDFDLTCGAGLAADLAASACAVPLAVCEAKGFFDRRHGG